MTWLLSDKTGLKWQNIKSGMVKNIPDFCYNYLAIILVSFIAWNYFGLLFIWVGAKMFELIERNKNYNIYQFLTNILKFTIAWMLGALFWLLEIDKGILALSMIILTYLIPFIAYKLLFKHWNVSITIALVLLYEYILNSVNSSFPWITLGNLLSNSHYLAYWYSYTGVLGGSFWVLLLSYLFFKTFLQPKTIFKGYFFGLLLLPLLFSALCYLNNSHLAPKNAESISAIVFNNQHLESANQNIETAQSIAKVLDSKKGDYFIAPEDTFRGLDKLLFDKQHIKNVLQETITKNKVKTVIVGTTFFERGKFPNNGLILLNKNAIYYKIKRKLIPLTEYLHPYLACFFSKLFFNYEGKDDLKTIIQKEKVLCVICYEAFYSSYIAQNLNKGKWICLVSSEHFFNGSYFGEKQYNNILRLRAIENNSPLLKSSSYGKTLLVNSLGYYDYISTLDISTIKFTIQDRIPTFYNNYGNSIVIVFLVLFLLFFCFKNFLFQILNKN